MSVLKNATSDIRKASMPHWPALSVFSGTTSGGTGKPAAAPDCI